MADCPPLTGNSDLYGLGVRIGLYAQWSATLLATVFEPANEAPLRLLNLVVQSAVFLGLCTESARAAAPGAAPGGGAAAALVTQLLLCGSLSSISPEGVAHLRSVTGLLRVLFYAAFAAYGVLFWFRGLDAMLVPGCHDVAFFGPASISGRFRAFGKAVSVAGLLACVGLVAGAARTVAARFSDLGSAFSRPAGPRAPRVEVALVLLSAGLLVLSAVTIEYLIRTNDIQGVGASKIGTVAQLIPLLAGTLACFLSVWKILFDGLIFKKRCWFLFGRHL